MQELILLPFLDLGRRHIQAQTTATDSFSKPSTSPHSTLLSTEICCYSAKPTPFSMTQAYFTKHTVFLSPTDPDSAKPSAGVGLTAAQGIRCTNPEARTDKLAFFRQQGRADIYNLDIQSSTALMVINLYGWQGAATNGKSRQSSDEETHK